MTVAQQVIIGTYRDSLPPDANRYVIPIPQVDNLWSDISAHVVKRCTSTNPYTWVSIEGGAGSPPTHEVPSGSINGSNVTFTLSGTYSIIQLFLNGLLLRPTTHFSLAGTTITITFAPATGDNLECYGWT